MRQLIVFSDPGGAKPCLALAKKWSDSYQILACSDRQYAFFASFGIPVRHCTSSDASKILDEFKPQALYTGTSYTSRVEIEFLKIAMQRGIPSTAFVDHYTGFRERFESNGNLVIPDQIDVLDERACNLAIKAGLPAKCLMITGNPYHEHLRSWRFSICKQDLWKKLGIPPSNAKSILFAPDPLSNAGGVEKFGNDEVAILNVLHRALEEIGIPVQLLIKAHPNQSLEYLKSGFKSCPENTQEFIIGIEHDAFLNDLIQQSDLVVGMFSSLLIEAALLKTEVLRILTGIKIDDPLRTHHVGFVVRTQGDLQKKIKKLLYK